MRVPLRETGSILVNAPRDHVFDLLRSQMAHAPDLRETPRERLETAERTYVLRDAPGGTRIIHAISRSTLLPNPGPGPRHELKAAIEAELLRVQRLIHNQP